MLATASLCALAIGLAFSGPVAHVETGLQPWRAPVFALLDQAANAAGARGYDLFLFRPDGYLRGAFGFLREESCAGDQRS